MLFRGTRRVSAMDCSFLLKFYRNLAKFASLYQRSFYASSRSFKISSSLSSLCRVSIPPWDRYSQRSDSLIPEGSGNREDPVSVARHSGNFENWVKRSWVKRWRDMLYKFDSEQQLGKMMIKIMYLKNMDHTNPICTARHSGKKSITPLPYRQKSSILNPQNTGFSKFLKSVKTESPAFPWF